MSRDTLSLEAMAGTILEEKYRLIRVLVDVVSIDAGPAYAPMSSTDGIWWHLAGKGWMADDFLIFPETCGCD